MSQTVIGSVLIILIGLGAVWLGLSAIRASFSCVPHPRVPTRRYFTPLEMRLRGMAFMAIGLSMIGYAVTGLRYLRAHRITVPPNAPLLDQIVWLLTLLLLWSFPLLALTMGLLRYTRYRRDRR